MAVEYKLPLSETERAMLSDILDAWLEPFDEATNDVMTAPELDTPEDMLSAVDGMRRQFEVVSSIRTKIGSMPYGRNASTV